MSISKRFLRAACAGALAAATAITQSAPANAGARGQIVPPGNIAYVIRRDTPEILSYRNFLVSKGYAVTIVPLGLVLSTDFGAFDLTIIADDTGSLNTWGIPPSTAAQVAKILVARKPILGIGEGGYAFFGQVPAFIGWPQGWHGPQALVNRAAGAPPSIFAGLPPDPIRVYNNPSNEVGIFLGAGVPADAQPIGLEPPAPDHASLIREGCHFLWGFSDGPDKMTANGQTLFENYVQYARFFQCAPNPTPPPQDCYRLVKSATPVSGTTVTPGAVIEYSISYAINPSGGPICPKEGKLVDVVPADTAFVPGSASDGISPAADGSLTWSVAGTGMKTFKVIVLDTVCRPGVRRTITNKAVLYLPSYLPVPSNVVTHNVQCPPIGFPNDKPPYAEDEIQITPYPIIAGRPTEVSVKVSNNTGSTVTAIVRFQASPDKFGIGLSFGDFATKTVTIPANSTVLVKTTTTFAAPGHYCIQIRVDVQTQNGVVSIFTQRNLDVTEDLKPGVTDVLSFTVKNPESFAATINLVVINTCPGWTATVNPASVTLPPGGTTTAQLLVTPPNLILLGSGCHIDVQGWLVDPTTNLPKLIGGIRKLDVPPVRLPHPDIPWEEREISTRPDPAVAGQPAQICVELQNPLPFSRTVTLEYAVADFGAGIPFTPVATQTFTLPPNSIDKYCVPWTPAPGGTLHRCIRVTLKQPNYRDDHSQRNITIVRPLPGGFGQIRISARITNPDGISHTLQLQTNLLGFYPSWQPDLRLDDGRPLPSEIGPGQTLGILIGLLLPAQNMQAQNAEVAAANDPRVGDASSIQVNVLFDGASVGGFTVEFAPPAKVNMPILLKAQ
ncbi:MAG: hypothetical protein KatS3mg053_0950 [Candidatus Roseilinea sp.]|nr:MAG: hypothetical protein KatS3mg053_0950 [Candidatus Roseilinea sp.]